MKFTKIIYVIICIFCTYSYATKPIKDSIYTNPDWYNIIFPVISPDGKWLAYYKTHPRESTPRIASLINTTTKKHLELTDNFSFTGGNLLNDDIAILKNDNTIAILDLSTQTEILKLNNIINYDKDQSRNIIYTLNNEGDLSIQKLTKKGAEILCQTSDIKKFFINSSKSYIVYQDTSKEKNLYKLDLATCKKTFLTRIDKDLHSLQWNISDDHILFNHDQTNNLLLVNLNNNNIREIQLPKGKLHLLKKDFYSNNDLLITYNIATGEKYPESEYLDIWKGNSQQLYDSDYNPKYKFNYYAMVYNYDTKEFTELESNRRKEYLPITIPGFIINFDPIQHKNFLATFVPMTYYIQNIKTKESTLLTTYAQKKLRISPDNKHLLYPKADTDYWEVLTPETNTRITIENDLPAFKAPIWSTDSKKLYFQQGNNLVELDLKTNKITKLSNFNEPSNIDILNYDVLSNAKVVDNSKPIIFKVNINNKQAIYKNYKNKTINIRPFSSNRILDTFIIRYAIDQKSNSFAWMEENYNSPQTIYISKNNKTSMLVKSEIPEELYNWQQQKFVKYKDKYDTNLEGILFYPKNYDPSKKYPMVTYIYDKLWENGHLMSNNFVQPTLYNRASYNRALLLEQGYFVFLASTIVNKEGPGLSAVDCIENAIEAVLEVEPNINRNKIGLFGHSFGGYKASFIATHSNLFAAIISSAGTHDLIGTFTFRYNTNLKQPEYARVENSQFAMKESYAENPKKYINNSPLLHAHKIQTPIMFATGIEDQNVFWEQSRSMYTALKRINNTQTVALFYKDIKHAFNSQTHAKEAADYTQRTLDWWAYYLKDDKTIQWIDDAVNPNKESYVNYNFK